jgi:hypothetical protein
MDMDIDQENIDLSGKLTAPTQPTPTNVSAGEAAELMSTTVSRLRQQWLQSAVTIANVLKSGQTVHRGTFDDLRQLRENYEELERARMFLRGMKAQAEQNGGVAANGDSAPAAAQREPEPVA